MKKQERSEPFQVTWQEEVRTLTLGGEPVLEVRLSWPQVAGNGPLARGANRYYERLAGAWRRQWGRDLYWRACAALVQCREQSRPFTPWAAALSGAVSLETEELLSLTLTARETRGDRRTLEHRWGDIWRKADGAPVPLWELYPRRRSRRRALYRALEKAAGEAKRGGVFLDKELKKPLRRWFSPDRSALTAQGLEVYYPQCTVAPAVEGAVTLRLPLPDAVRTAQPGPADA